MFYTSLLFLIFQIILWFLSTFSIKDRKITAVTGLFFTWSVLNTLYLIYNIFYFPCNNTNLIGYYLTIVQLFDLHSQAEHAATLIKRWSPIEFCSFLEASIKQCSLQTHCLHVKIVVNIPFLAQLVTSLVFSTPANLQNSAKCCSTFCFNSLKKSTNVKHGVCVFFLERQNLTIPTGGLLYSYQASCLWSYFC